jgi:hypothetical protein
MDNGIDTPQIPIPKNLQIHAQNRSSIDTIDILQDINSIQKTELIQSVEEPLYYSCYHCDDFHTNSERDYERHVMSNHQKTTSDVDHPCYPCKADLERLGLIGRAMCML